MITLPRTKHSQSHSQDTEDTRQQTDRALIYTYIHRCMEPFPQVPHGHPQQAHSSARTTQCLNIHALGEQRIEEVTHVEIVQTPQEECLEGEHLKPLFKAHIRGWKTEIRKELCQQLLDKSDHNLRRALLRPLWKDVLLIPQAWYPEHKPRYETQGWWYVPAKEILGRECKSCRAFHELAEYEVRTSKT